MRLRDHNVQESHVLPIMHTAAHTHAITQDDTFNGVANVLRVSLSHQSDGTLAWVMKVVTITELVERVKQRGIEASYSPRFLNARV
eukprot:9564858-Lingulodinium_polyedra.AAC.1